MATSLQYISKWGNPGIPGKPNTTWTNSNIVRLTLPWDMVALVEDGAPVHDIQVHRLASPHFLSALNAVWSAAQKNALLHHGLSTRQILHSFGGDIFSGSFVLRYVRGYEDEKILSPHSFGIAIDINAQRNPMGKPLCTTFPSWYVAAWKSAGFIWGGDFHNRPDAMHFEVQT